MEWFRFLEFAFSILHVCVVDNNATVLVVGVENTLLYGVITFLLTLSFCSIVLRGEQVCFLDGALFGTLDNCLLT